MSWLILLVVVMFTIVPPALAGDVSNGSKVFSANCASCHINGTNVINRSKTLSKDDLSKYGMDSMVAIVNQVTNGKPPMPSFKSRLSSQQIEDVASYVLAQSENGW